MTTARQVKQLVSPMLTRNRDLILHGRFIIITPVHHIVVGFIVDRTRDAAVFRPATFVNHLIDENTTSIGLSLGQEIYPHRKELWSIDDAQAPDSLASQLEPVILPHLRTLTSFETYIAYARGHPFATFLRWPLRRIIVDVAMGELDAARVISRDVVAGLSAATYGRDADDKEHLRKIKELCRRLDADDRAGMAALLHGWEAISVRNLKLEHV
ncbi:MAG: hypothetical protein ACKVP7_06200 [Hyphomicrobiaceae bacterium]